MEHPKSPILAHSNRTIERLLRHRWAIAGVGSVALFGVVTAFATAPAGEEEPVQLQTVLEQLSTQSAVLLNSTEHVFLREERIQRADNIASLLTRLGISEPAALDFIRRNEATQAIARQLRPGKTVTARTSELGNLHTLYFPLNGKDAVLVVERSGDSFRASEQTLPLQTNVVVRSGEIRNSLFGATDAAGIPDAIATQLAEIFAADIDFYRDLRKGDRFSIVYEAMTHHGQPVRSGRILAAEFANNNRNYSAYWHQGSQGKGGYYSADGKPMRKAFLRTPLEFSRVTSGFSNARLHPVLQITRAHKGIDYGAPTGTKVRSVADGVVDFAGRQGGYGNLIVLKHQGAYTTAYGHLNGFASGIKKGARVSQGDTIGYVGQTGVATGPHLHYEFRVNGQQVNPMAINLPAAQPLDAQQMAAFKKSSSAHQTHLDLAKQQTVASIE